ncbi:MAG: flagellar basal-body MS-ring/collar protein FliF [Thermodesulfobacteriota bacterium]|nr:flagellar basal-body MS-ring/collar protein FliF [Thermodesulfobacteriota bacterium]
MATPKEMLQQAVTTIKGMTLSQKVIGGAIVFAVLAGLISLVVRDSSVSHKVLFSGLTQEDAADVVTFLKDQRVSYKLSEDGTAIMVPSDKVHETRLSLAGAGLPHGGGVGFEIFDKTSLGTTDYVQRLNYQRALQGELARTIRQFHQVREARVHIATPKDSVFIEDEKPATASISVKLQSREKLSQHQVKSIVNLVACAVPGLSSDNITVVDTAGRLLFRMDGSEEAVLSASQLEYQQKLENGLRRKTESMIEEIVGINRVQARVTAEIDFNRLEQTEDIYDPEGQVIRSEQLLSEDDVSGGGSTGGIPGVKGNLATYAGAGGAGSGESSHRRSNLTKNYEISKITKHSQAAPGAVRRLSIAVMVDGTYEKVVDKDGNASLKYIARTREEMQQFKKIVQRAIGYDEERGDQVEVVNMPYALSSVLEPEPEPLDKWRALIEQFSMPFVYLIIGVMFMLFVVRPFFRILSKKQFEVTTEARSGGMKGVEEEEEEDLKLKHTGLTDKERMYKLAQSDPDRAADLVRRWLREEM